MWFDPDRTKKRRLNKIGQSVYTERLAQSPNIRNESWQHDSSYLSVEKTADACRSNVTIEIKK